MRIIYHIFRKSQARLSLKMKPEPGHRTLLARFPVSVILSVLFMLKQAFPQAGESQIHGVELADAVHTPVLSRADGVMPGEHPPEMRQIVESAEKGDLLDG